MSSIIWDEWGAGQDLRKAETLSVPNALRKLSNCYINNGKAIKKRPCLTKVATLEAGTIGLKAISGKLNTFYARDGDPLVHANTLFKANRVCFPGNSALAPYRCTFGENFLGYTYCAIEYADGSVRHHYLDDPGVWIANQIYAGGAYCRANPDNGFRYQVVLGGGGTSGGTQPSWPTVLNATVTDSGVTWMARDYAITDQNCPHSQQVKKMGQKIYAAAGEDVAFCDIANPRDWTPTSTSDAGAIPSGINAAGSALVRGLGDFQGDLVSAFADSLQVWHVDADPDANVLKTNSPNIGTLYGPSMASFANDLTLLTKQGVRSVSSAIITENLQENDIGSPIDKLRPEIVDATDIESLFSIFYPTLGQLWMVNRSKAYVLSYSKSAKISAWSTYTFPCNLDCGAILGGVLYLRSGNDVYRVDELVFQDAVGAGSIPLCEADMYYQDNKTPGIEKLFAGFDAAVIGAPEIAFKVTTRDGSLQTDYIELSLDSRPGQMLPMEIAGTSIAPTMRHQRNEDFRLDLLQCYYENLGPV